MVLASLLDECVVVFLVYETFDEVKPQVVGKKCKCLAQRWIGVFVEV